MAEYKLWNALKEAKNYKWVELSHSLNNESPYWSGIPEGSVIEITITKPGAQPVTTNFRVLQDDVEMVEALKNMQK